MEVDPLTPLSQGVCGLVYLLEGDFKNCLSAFQRMYDLEPDNPLARFFYSLGLFYNHRNEDAYTVIDLLRKEQQDSHFAKLSSFLMFSFKGDKKKALKSVTKDLEAAAWWDEQWPWEMAVSYALIDEKEKALDWLERAVSRGWICYPFLSDYDPLLENIRSEPRFKKLMERVKHEWENFEV
jgi:non-specific serine/threonine protein kinase